MQRVHKGFSLIEITILLVIIGLTLSVISIGEDLQQNAEMHKIKQQFVDKWVEAYDRYYEKAGVVLGDSLTMPRHMVAGENLDDLNYAYSKDTALPDFPPVRDKVLHRICQGSGYRQYEEENDRVLSSKGLHDLMTRQGVAIPSGLEKGGADRYVYSDAYGNERQMQVCFQWNGEGRVDGTGNMMIIRGLTLDMARELDLMVDGTLNARQGRFRQNNNALVSNVVEGNEWRVRRRLETRPHGVDGGKVPPAFLVTAMYKMNQ